MFVLNAQQLQRLAESLLRLERLLENEGGDPGMVREGLDEAAHRMGVHLDVVRLADVDTLLLMHGPGRGGDAGKLWAVAEILYMDGLVAHAEGHLQDARARLTTAARLYDALPTGLDLPEGAVPPADRRDLARAYVEGEAA